MLLTGNQSLPKQVPLHKNLLAAAILIADMSYHALSLWDSVGNRIATTVKTWLLIMETPYLFYGTISWSWSFLSVLFHGNTKSQIIRSIIKMADERKVFCNIVHSQLRPMHKARRWQILKSIIVSPRKETQVAASFYGLQLPGKTVREYKQATAEDPDLLYPKLPPVSEWVVVEREWNMSTYSVNQAKLQT